jgi:RNA polymerase sigma-70 factor, ECF subfamily
MTLQEMTDEQLVAEIGRGEMQALALLVNRHQQWALRLAYRSLGDWHLAEDAVQEAFLRVNRAAPQYRPNAKFSTWFYRIVVNLCMDELRKRQRRSETSSEITADPATVDSPLHQQEVTEIQEAVHRALTTLNDRERMAVILHRFEGQSHRQIAEITEVSASAVESLLVRAYRKLRQELASFSDISSEKPQG